MGSCAASAPTARPAGAFLQLGADQLGLMPSKRLLPRLHCPPQQAGCPRAAGYPTLPTGGVVLSPTVRNGGIWTRANELCAQPGLPRCQRRMLILYLLLVIGRHIDRAVTRHLDARGKLQKLSNPALLIIG